MRAPNFYAFTGRPRGSKLLHFYARRCPKTFTPCKIPRGALSRAVMAMRCAALRAAALAHPRLAITSSRHQPCLNHGWRHSMQHALAPPPTIFPPAAAADCCFTGPARSRRPRARCHRAHHASCARRRSPRPQNQRRAPPHAPPPRARPQPPRASTSQGIERETEREDPEKNSPAAADA